MGHLISLFLAASAALFAYVLVAAISPTRRCPRCKGAMVVAAGRGFRQCPKCKGGRTYRPGAVLVHQLLQEHIGPWIRDRIRPVHDEEGGR